MKIGIVRVIQNEVCFWLAFYIKNSRLAHHQTARKWGVRKSEVVRGCEKEVFVHD